MAQVSFAEDDDMIKTFPSDRTNQPFRMAILPWRSRCGWPVTNPPRVKAPFKYLAVNAVAIADDMPRHLCVARTKSGRIGDEVRRGLRVV